MPSRRLPLAVFTAAVGLGCGGSCGGSKAPPPTAETVAGEWQEASGDRVVVATVAGEPVYADCVEDRVAEREMTLAAALDECIELEVLAQEARRLSYLEDPEVIDVRKREMVRVLLDQQFYAKFATPEDIPLEDVKQIWDRGLKDFFNHPETRNTFYCRAANPDASGKTPVGGGADAKAREVADEIYRRARNQVALDPEKLLEICNQSAVDLGGIAKIASDHFGFPRHNRAVEEFAAPAFAIARPGQVAPPARTAWGWDIILLLEIFPAREEGLQEATAEVRKMMFEKPGFEGYRRQHFLEWIDAHVGAATIERFDENLPADELPSPAGPPRPAP